VKTRREVTVTEYSDAIRLDSRFHGEMGDRLDPGIDDPVSHRLVVFSLSAVSAAQDAPAWIKKNHTDPMSGASYVKFVLFGKFLRSPKSASAGDRPVRTKDSEKEC
jgi:hypothetical protein